MKSDGKTGVVLSAHMPRRNRVFRWLLTLARTILFDVTIEGKEHIPTGNCMIVANHLSWIDHLLPRPVLPAEPRPYLVGASQSIASPFKRWMLTALRGVTPFE